MAAFRFRLETVLRLREEERRACQLRLVEALRAEEVLAERRADLAAELALQRELHRQAAHAREVEADRILSYERYEALLRADDQALAGQMRRLAEEIEIRREALAEAHRQVRTLERLRQRQAERHAADEAARDRRILDEIGAQRAFAEAET